MNRLIGISIIATTIITFGCAKTVKKDLSPFDGVFTDSTWVIIEKTWFDKAKAASTPDSMAEDISKFKTLRPTSKYLAELYYDLGERFKKEEQYADAVAAYRQVVTYSDPRYQPDAYLAIAECYFKLSDWQNAAKEYLEFTKKFPKHQAVAGAFYYAGASYFNIGNALLGAGKLDGGKECIEKAKKLFLEILKKYPNSEFRENARKSLEASGWDPF